MKFRAVSSTVQAEDVTINFTIEIKEEEKCT